MTASTTRARDLPARYSQGGLNEEDWPRPSLCRIRHGKCRFCPVNARHPLAAKPIQDSAPDCHIAEGPHGCTSSHAGTEDKRQIPKNAGQARVATGETQRPACLSAEHERDRPNHVERAADGQGVNSEAPAAFRRPFHNQARAAERLSKSRDAEADRNEKSNPRSQTHRLPCGTAPPGRPLRSL